MLLQRLIGAAVLAVGAVTASVQISVSAPDQRSLPMQFTVEQEGPANLCGGHCRTWIAAVGTITSDTPAVFAAFAKGRNIKDALLVLDSSGGSVHGTMRLGRAIRRLGMTTTVGRTHVITADGPDKGRATLSPHAYCESMCAFLLLSGKQRFVPPQAQVLVHEIWLGDRRDDAAAATYSAEDLVVVQRDIGMLAQYTVEMGGSIDLLGTALRIPPWEPLRKLSGSEMRQMGLDTVAALPDKGSQTLAVSTSAAPLVPHVAATEHGWTVSEKLGQSLLTREHPLTIEGDEVGDFDVVFACTDAADSYDATYIERRHGSHAHPVTEALKQVSISVGRRSVALKVITSDVRTKEGDIDSVARGTVPASLVQALGRPGSHALTVRTATADDVEAVIRVGNTGVAKNLPGLAASCRAPATPSRADAHAELQPAQAAAAANGGQRKE
jgi:hypothetical protein